MCCVLGSCCVLSWGVTCALLIRAQVGQFRLSSLADYDIDGENPLGSGQSAVVYPCRVRIAAGGPFDASMQGRQFAMKRLYDFGEWCASV